MNLLTQEQIENFPVNHLSVSAIRQYMSCPQLFFKRYIRLEFDQERGPALYEGSAVHAILEAYWNARKDGRHITYPFSQSDIFVRSFKEQIAIIDKDDAEGKIYWGKTGSREKSLGIIANAIEFYFTELPGHKTILDVEAKFLTDFEDLEGNTLPIPLKGFCDLLVENANGDLIIIDHKLVTSPVLQEETNAGYELQAAAYWFLVRKYYGKNPACMIFDQIKKTKNRDGSPQITQYVIEYTPTLLNAFIEVYRRIVTQLSGQPVIDEQGYVKFIPNPFSMFDGEASWLDFKEEIETGKDWNINEFKSNRLNLDNIPLLDL